MTKVFHVRFKSPLSRRVAAYVPVSPLALAVIWGMTLRHVLRKNPHLSLEASMKVANQLTPEVTYRLYKRRR